MKKNIYPIIIMLVLISALSAIDDKYLYQLAHVRSNPANSIMVSEKQVFTRNQNQIWIHSTFNPWQPRVEASFLSAAQIEDVNVLGDMQIYISTREPANVIVPVDSLNSYGRIYFINHIPGDKLTREGATLYVADRFKGIDIINIGTGGLREVLSTFSEKWGVRDFIARYPYLYALNDFGLVTVDISDMQFPLSMGTNYQIYDAKVLRKNGDVLWIGAGKNLMAISIRDMNNPVVINQFRLSNDITDMEIANDRLFIAQGRGGVKILDIRNPLRINDINTINTNFTVYDVAIEGDLILLALGRDGWMIYEYR